jgi:hypothetical protein
VSDADTRNPSIRIVDRLEEERRDRDAASKAAPARFEDRTDDDIDRIAARQHLLSDRQFDVRPKVATGVSVLWNDVR